MIQRARLFLALLTSATAHAAILLVHSPGLPPVVPGMAGEAVRVTLLAPRKSASGSQVTEHPTTTGLGGSMTPRDDLPHDRQTSIRPTVSDTSQEARLDASAREPDDATVTAHTLQAMLHEAFTAHFHYPPLARQKGWQGEVRLALRIEPDGKLARIRIITSSGYGILDSAALRSLKAVNRLPHAATLLKGSGLNLILPVRYQLFDS